MFAAELARRRRLEKVTLANGYCANEVEAARAALAKMGFAAEQRDTQKEAKEAAEHKKSREAEAAARQKAAREAEASRQKAAREANEAEPEISDDAQRGARQKALLGFVILLARYAIRLIFLPIACLVNWIDTGHLWPHRRR
jgi:hypothetical protein